MNVCFLLTVSILIQYLFIFIIKSLFPQLIGNSFFSFFQMAFLSFVAVFLPAYLYLKDEKKSYFTDCFSDVSFGKLVPVSFFIGICGQYIGIAANIPLNYLIYLINGEVSHHNPTINSLPLFIAGIIILCVLPAIFEEVLFRGIIFNYFRQFGVKAAIIISALLFSIMHLDFTNILGTFILGIICGIMVKYTNRLIYPMITHFALNLVSVLSIYISQFEILQNIYNDLFLMFILVSIPLIIYLIGIFRQNAVSYSYHDQNKYNYVTEKIIKINEENSIKIIEHDVKDNNLRMAFSKLFLTPYFYILVVLFVLIGGSKI